MAQFQLSGNTAWGKHIEPVVARASPSVTVEAIDLEPTTGLRIYARGLDPGIVDRESLPEDVQTIILMTPSKYLTSTEPPESVILRLWRAGHEVAVNYNQEMKPGVSTTHHVTGSRTTPKRALITQGQYDRLRQLTS